MSAASSRSNSVEIRARVSGYLDKVHFTDGQMVKEGDLLFTIDRRPFQNARRSGARNARAGKGQSRLRRSRPRPRPAARARQDHHRADLRSAHAGQAHRRGDSCRPTKRWCGRPSSICNSPELRAPVAAASAIAASRPAIWSPAGPSSTTTLLATIVSTDPIRFEFTFDEASYLRYERLAQERHAMSRAAARGVPVSLKLIDETGIRPSRPHGLRRQRDRSRHRHDPRPRAVSQSRRDFHARHVRARAGAGVAALRRAARAGRRDRHRAGPQIRLCGRPGQRRVAEIRHARSAQSTACA